MSQQNSNAGGGMNDRTRPNHHHNATVTGAGIAHNNNNANTLVSSIGNTVNKNGSTSTSNGLPVGLDLSMFAAAMAAAASSSHPQQLAQQQQVQQQQGLAALLASLKQQSSGHAPGPAPQQQPPVAAPSPYALPASNLLPQMFHQPTVQQQQQQQQQHTFGTHAQAPIQQTTAMDASAYSLQAHIAALLGSTAAAQQMQQQPQPNYLQQLPYPLPIPQPQLPIAVAAPNTAANPQQKAIEDFLRSAVAQATAAAAVVSNGSGSSSAPSSDGMVVRHSSSSSVPTPMATSSPPPPAQPPAPSATMPISSHLPSQLPTSRPALSIMGGVAPAVANHFASTPLLSDMQSWPLEKLEQHVSVLQQLNQHIPHNVIMLLQDARRRSEKRHAKRIANRKSASTSRARKKALVKEMTELNARLKRQALILALLPDLVIAIDLQGVITFCSAQVERVLQYNADDLIGVNLNDILASSSRGRLRNLISKLARSVAENGLEVTDCLGNTNGDTDENAPKEGVLNEYRTKKETDTKSPNPVVSSKANTPSSKNGMCNELEAGEKKEESKSNGGGASIGINSSLFPLSVVNVGCKQSRECLTQSSDVENDNSDGSGNDGDSGQQPSSLTASAAMSDGDNSNVISSLNNNPTAREGDAVGSKDSADKNLTGLPSSDLSNSSSNVTDTTNLQNANANLERNVRWHNKKLKSKDSNRAGLVDDVLGAAITANNASARLSSLQHHAVSCPGSSSSSDREDDSGYRESNDSREADTSSSEWDSKSDTNGRQKPIAPTCNISLVRHDRTTLSCEVTSSIRTKSTADDEEGIDDINSVGDVGQVATSGNVGAKKSQASEQDSKDGNSRTVQVHEILLCLRPIREGGSSSQVGKQTAYHRFSKKNKKISQVASIHAASDSSLASRNEQRLVSEESNTDRSSGDEPKTRQDCSSDDLKRQLESSFRPLKKRPPPKAEEASFVDVQKYPTPTMNNKSKKMKTSRDVFEASALDASVVAESLMLMTKQQQKNL